MAVGNYLMVFRRDRGNATIEGAMIFPLILLITFLCIGLGVFFYNQFLQLESSSYAVRKVGEHWYDGKTLYEDVLFDFDSSEVVEEKKGWGVEYFNYRMQPIAGGNISQEFTYENLIISKKIFHETSGNGGSNAFYYPVLTGSYFIRAADLTDDILSDAFSYFEKKEKDDEGKEGNSDVYVVDGSDKGTDYKKVYHLYGDCFYMRNGYESKQKKENVRGEGFRCCRVCLGRKTGLDE